MLFTQPSFSIIPEARRKNIDLTLTNLKKSEASPRTFEEILASKDFKFFRQYCCNHDTLPHQEAWVKAIFTGDTQGELVGIAGEDTTILAPRGSAKSSLMIEFLAWYIGYLGLYYNLNIKIIYICYQPKLALAKSRQIKSIIALPTYKRVFPTIREGDKWGEGEWCIDLLAINAPPATEPYTLVCSGMDSGIVGSRGNLIIFDDIIKNRQVAENKDVQEKMQSNYSSAIKFVRLPNSREICLGTLYAKRDIMSRVFMNKDKFKLLRQSALIKNDKGEWESYWEPKKPGDFGYTKESLLAEMNSDDPLERQMFLLQRQNEYPDEMSVGFDKSWIKPMFVPQEFHSLFIGADLALSGKKESDESSFTICGVTKQKNVIVLENDTGKYLSGMDKIKRMHKLWETWKSSATSSELSIGIDANKYHVALQNDFEYLANNREVAESLQISKSFLDANLHTIPSANRGADKLDRLLAHSSLFESQRITFNKVQLIGESATLKALVDEIVDYNPIGSNDRLDSFEVALSTIKRQTEI